MALQNEKQSPYSPAEASELERLRIAVEQLSSRVANLESARASNPVAAATTAATQQSSFGLKFINRTGALTLAIGVIFFFKYAVDENLIGAIAGVWLGVLFGLALLAGGEWLIQHDQRIFAQGVSGCGLATIYISIYASFAFYKLVIDAFGFFALVCVCALAVVLSLRYKNPAIAALGFMGALLTPILLHKTGTADVGFGLPYVLIVEVTAVVIALRQQWAILVAIVPPFSMLAGAFLFGLKNAFWLGVLALIIGVIQFGSMALAPAIAGVRNTLYVVGHSCLLVGAFQFVRLATTQKSVEREVDSVLLAVYGIGLLFYGMLRTSAVNRIFGLVLLGLVIAKLYLADVWVLARGYRITAFIGLGVLLLVASYVYSRSDKRSRV